MRIERNHFAVRKNELPTASASLPHRCLSSVRSPPRPTGAVPAPRCHSASSPLRRGIINGFAASTSFTRKGASRDTLAPPHDRRHRAERRLRNGFQRSVPNSTGPACATSMTGADLQGGVSLSGDASLNPTQLPGRGSEVPSPSRRIPPGLDVAERSSRSRRMYRGSAGSWPQDLNAARATPEDSRHDPTDRQIRDSLVGSPRPLVHHSHYGRTEG